MFTASLLILPCIEELRKDNLLRLSSCFLDGDILVLTFHVQPVPASLYLHHKWSSICREHASMVVLKFTSHILL